MKKDIFSVGIIGCGLIGNKRANSLGARGKLVACSDIEVKKARSLAQNIGAEVYQDYQSLIERSDIDIVIVSTLHNSLAEITTKCILAGKHVLVEKPAAKNVSELEKVLKISKDYKTKIRVGFNHRFHRSLLQAKYLIDSDEIGDLMFVRARYGHGGRIGYDKEWRASPELSGGGELIDQGSHLIDLSRWFLGEFSNIEGYANTYYWDMPVEDNGFMLLKTKDKKVAFLHASCTEWKNLFSMEIYGKKGKLDINGLGGSYGTEKLTHYRMLPEMGPPETFCWEYPMSDNSWKEEMNAFYDDIAFNRESNPSIIDALKVMQVIEKIYIDSNYDYSSKSS